MEINYIKNKMNIFKRILGSKKILVLDINYLPSEHKGIEITQLKKDLQKEYDRDVLLIDTSRRNLQGGSFDINPVYSI